MVSRCQSILETATEYAEALGEYGIAAGKLSALKKKLETFQSVLVAPRAHRTVTRAATRSLRTLFQQARTLIRGRLDGLMVQFKESEPAFYQQYRAARVVGAKSGKSVVASIGVVALPTPAATPTAKAA